jgi:hypothetical protein
LGPANFRSDERATDSPQGGRPHVIFTNPPRSVTSINEVLAIWTYTAILTSAIAVGLGYLLYKITRLM